MKKRLTKSSNNVVVSGTLAGVAEFIGIDATIVRVIYVILSLFTVGFPGFFLYIALMLLLPSGGKSGYRHTQSFEQPYRDSGSHYENSKGRPRKEAEKVEEEDWSDF